ncbi:MAG: hypothetical protein WBL84_29315, partial [Xanthobacteraceae bacterium]
MNATNIGLPHAEQIDGLAAIVGTRRQPTNFSNSRALLLPDRRRFDCPAAFFMHRLNNEYRK